VLPGPHLSRAEVTVAVLNCGLLGLACAATYVLVTRGLASIHSVSPADDQLGGLWAVIATVFVCTFSYERSIKAAVSRIAGTLVSFVLCTIYLIFLPFHVWALGVLIGGSALVTILMGRPQDAAWVGLHLIHQRLGQAGQARRTSRGA
jgi:uncharacterized membrane protein